MIVVVNEGFEALTIARLARDADAAVGALYRYFPSKDALIAALQRQAIARFSAFQADQIATIDGGSDRALDRVRAAFSAWSAFADEEPEAFALVDRSISDGRALLSDDAARDVNATLAPILDRCADLLDQAANAGLLTHGDGRMRAYALWAAVHGAAQFRKRDRLAEVDSHQIREELVTAALTGWGAASQPAGRARP